MSGAAHLLHASASWLRLPDAVAWLARGGAISPGELLAWQSRALARIVRHAYDRVPFYREHLDRAGIGRDGVRGLADLARLPVLRKDALRDRPLADLVAAGLMPDRLLSVATSGSTGRPMRIHKAWLEQRLLHLFRLRAQRQLGIGMRDKVAEIDPAYPPHPRDSKIIGRGLALAGLDNRLRLSLFEPAGRLLDRLAEFAPAVVAGYPNVLLRLGEALAERGRAGVRPRVVLTHSEVLTGATRAALRELWRADVHELYDCHECNLLAWECPDGHGLHCCDDSVIVEVLRDGRPVEVGQRGEVVITSLHSYAMPFIRFAMHDLATRGPSPCPCGQPYSTIRAVEGRMDDLIVLPDGRWLHPAAILDDLDRDGPSWARQYRLVQEREDRIVLSVVPAPGATGPRLEQLRQLACAAVGPRVEVVARFVDRLDPGPSGKTRIARSLVHTTYDGIDWSAVQTHREPSARPTAQV